MDMVNETNAVSNRVPFSNNNINNEINEYDSKLAIEIQNIELHFNNIVDLLKKKKHTVIEELRSSMTCNNHESKGNFWKFQNLIQI